MLEMDKRSNEQSSRKGWVLPRKEERLSSSKKAVQFLGGKKKVSREVNGQDKNKD